MKLFRFGLASTLSALALATPTDAVAVPVPTLDAVVAVTTAAPTESPLDVAESTREQARQFANQSLHVVMQEAGNYSQFDDSEDLIDQEVAHIEAAVPNTTHRWAKARMRKFKHTKKAKEHLVKDHMREAKRASKAYKRAASDVERLRERSGVPESVYERDYEQDEHTAEHWGDLAEDYGDLSKDHVELFYEHVRDKLEHHIDEEEQSEEEQQERQRDEDQDGDFGSDEDSHHRAGNRQASAPVVELPAVASAPAPAPVVAPTVAVAVPTVDAVVPTTAAPTASPLAAAESARDRARDLADQSLRAVVREEGNYSQADNSTELIDQEVAKIEAAVPNTTVRYERERMRKLRQVKKAKTDLVKGQMREAKRAAKGYKRAARNFERLRRRSGVSESVYERDMELDEHTAEHWGDLAEDYGDLSKDHIQLFYEHVRGLLQFHIQEEEQRATWQQERQEARQERREARQERQTEREWEGQENGDWDADDHDQHDQAGDPNGANQQNIVTSPGPIALAVTASGGQGFLLTFACVGSLAALTFVVQLGRRVPRRSSNQQASEPLLSA